MSWFNKKDDKNVLDKPELPDLPDLDNSNFQLPAIKPASPPTKPISLPQDMSPIQPNRITQEISPKQKQGMQKSRFDSESVLPEIPQNNLENFEIESVPEPPHYEPPRLSYPIQEQIEEQIPKYTSQQLSLKPLARSLPKKDDSVYIRLDKFQATMEAFRDILGRIREIEELLARTKEIKNREEKELDEWEREIQTIKMRINSIDREISSP